MLCNYGAHLTTSMYAMYAYALHLWRYVMNKTHPLFIASKAMVLLQLYMHTSLICPHFHVT